MVALEKKEVIVVAEKEKQEEVITAIYKLNLHCQECARSIQKHITKISGVQKVDTDSESGKVTVKGVFDVKKVHELIEKKSKRKVELISPKPKEKDDKGSAVVEKKEELVRTVVMKVHMHCEKCEHDLKWRLLKLKGVHSVKMSREAGTCTVTGTVEEKKLIEYVRRKTKKHVEVVPQKQKEEEKKKTEHKGVKEKEAVAKGGAKEERKKVEIVEKKDEVKVTEIAVPYFIHCTHAPQWFSDEDPNSCSVM